MNQNFLSGFIILLTSQLVFGYLNLYLSLAEVQRLLGLEAELYYVRDGNINNYALNFVMPVPSSLNSLHFTWESLADRPLLYTIKVDTSDSQILLPPQLNITSRGSVPTTLQTFSLSLLCSGAATGEVNVTITISVTITPSNVTTLMFRRKKICTKFEMQTNHVLVHTVPTYSNSTSIFYTAIVSALILIIILASVTAAYYVKNKKTRDTTSASTGPTTTFLTTGPRNTVNTSYSSFRRMPSYSLIDERSKDLQERITELTVQRCRVRLSNVIMEGTFARVYQGSYTNEEGVDEPVIVKTVTDHASQIQISLLLQEGMSMYSLNHKNILSILRVSIEDHTAPFLLYAYNNYSNLKIFLQKCKLSPEGVSHTLTTQEVVDMALQIIQAMQYLHKKNLLHKDLATRNCIVDDKLNVQVADNALSRDLFPSDYHCLGDNENRPIKWMAIESLVHKTFSFSSDVWSFGVLLWELTTLAQQPYVEIDPFEIVAYLKDGYRLAQPINCPDELFAVMAYCWAMSAEERPTFTQLHICLQDFYTQLTRYV
ncbi:tyrosine-protein kinase Drl [Tribolium castaneum]|uniref:receptor protein-tyrosine kinase n=1 Tax=Tribolium castaneum TaxID=7070 RepID=D6W7I8_TRICA|nr:PREDICTED: tyrosine-protein kinase Drl [Tribolium castaneum]EFA11279.1 Tyrosine-protein kinase Dnt-like Protein [Tribolium castaneum]|eukprot:XP_969941.1 PREDICTED: tyrosine-protein kinase Drl [Tribolium castaneum]